MTYGRDLDRVTLANFDGTVVSHQAELVRGNLSLGEGPLIRPYGPPSPQGEKGRKGSQDKFSTAAPIPSR